MKKQPGNESNTELNRTEREKHGLGYKSMCPASLWTVSL
jgi:hypothetical protein